LQIAQSLTYRHPDADGIRDIPTRSSGGDVAVRIASVVDAHPCSAVREPARSPPGSPPEVGVLSRHRAAAARQQKPKLQLRTFPAHTQLAPMPLPAEQDGNGLAGPQLKFHSGFGTCRGGSKCTFGPTPVPSLVTTIVR